MKYENLEEANRICKEIRSIKNIIYKLKKINPTIRICDEAGWSFHTSNSVIEKDNYLFTLYATAYKKNVIFVYEKQLRALKYKLKKL